MKLFSLRSVLCLLAASATLLAAPLRSEAQALDRIKKAGVVRIGIIGDQRPWGFIDAKGELRGYDADVARLVAEELGVKLELQNNVTSARIPSLLTNKIDLQMGIMGMYPDRAKVVQFSKPYAHLQIQVMASKKLKVESIEDLRKIRIGVPRTASQDIALTKMLGDVPNIRRFDDDSSTVQALVSGQVDAVGGNTTYKFSFDRSAPGHDYEQKMVLHEQWMGITSKLGDKEMNAWLNQFIDKIRADGRLEAISQQYLGLPLPQFPASVEGVPFTVQ